MPHFLCLVSYTLGTVFKAMSCLQDNVLSPRQCLVFKTMFCLQDNVLSSRQCLVFKTKSCLQDTVLSSRQCCVICLAQMPSLPAASPLALHRGLVKCDLISHFVLPKVVCLVTLIQAVPTFCRPAPLVQ